MTTYRQLKTLKHRLRTLTHSHVSGTQTGNGIRKIVKFIGVEKAKFQTLGRKVPSRWAERHRHWTISALHSRKGRGGKTTASNPTKSDEDLIQHRRAERFYAGYLVCLGAAIAEGNQTINSDNVNKPTKWRDNREVKIIVGFPQWRLPKATWCW